MNRLIAAVMVGTIVAIVVQLVQGATPRDGQQSRRSC
jgi:hypothetical protein